MSGNLDMIDNCKVRTSSDFDLVHDAELAVRFAEIGDFTGFQTVIARDLKHRFATKRQTRLSVKQRALLVKMLADED